LDRNNQDWLGTFSVLGNERHIEVIVDARRDEIDILADAIVTKQGTRRAGVAVIQEGVGIGLQEDVVVFDRKRPVPGKTIFETDADRTTPAACRRWCWKPGR
jgi:hypothetical protein